MLWTPLAEVSRAYRTQHGLDLSLTTNGTRLDRNAIRALLLDYYSEVTISIDGFAAAHVAQRGLPGLHSALEQSVTRLAADKRAAGHGPLLRANVVLMRGNIAHFAPLCRELPRWGIEGITFNQLGGNGQPEIFPANRLSPKQARAFAAQVPALRRELADMGVRLCGTDD